MLLVLIAIFMVFVLWLFVVDYMRKVKPGEDVLLTFIVPCYNDAATVGDTIDSIYASYPHDKIILYVINDKSTDNSWEIIAAKQKQYGFSFLQNEVNQGKVATINNTIDLVQTDHFIIVDADTHMATKALHDMLGRIQYNKNVAAVSCYYKPINGWFLALMQGIEYHMLALIQWAYNIWSTVSLRWGCMMVQTNACRQIGKFNLSAIVEDMDMAFRLNLHGYRVEQSYVAVATHVPDTLKTRFKQKIRWNSWGFQCFVTYPRVWIKNPIHVIFTLLTNGLFLFISINIYKQFLTLETFAGLFFGLIDVMTFRQSVLTMISLYTAKIREAFSTKLAYTMFSIPYVFPYFLRLHTLRKVLLIFPFVWIYVPLFSILWIFGFVWWVYRTLQLRSWRRAR